MVSLRYHRSCSLHRNRYRETLAAGFPFWTAIIMGTMTGAGGGVFRDVFINEVPLIFRREIYALACVVGGVAYFICHQMELGNIASGLICGLFVIITRILAVHYKIHLPTLKSEDLNNEDLNNGGNSHD